MPLSGEATKSMRHCGCQLFGRPSKDSAVRVGIPDAYLNHAYIASLIKMDTATLLSRQSLSNIDQSPSTDDE
jgi:hypothetical protein